MYRDLSAGTSIPCHMTVTQTNLTVTGFNIKKGNTKLKKNLQAHLTNLM